MDKIYYQAGYKYRLYEEYQVQTELYPPWDMASHGGFVELLANGTLILKQGYASDGPSGPTFDTRNFMRGAFTHDGLYQLLREGLDKRFRKPADKLLRQICREDGMSWLRAWYVYKGVRIGAKRSATFKGGRKIHSAP